MRPSRLVFITTLVMVGVISSTTHGSTELAPIAPGLARIAPPVPDGDATFAPVTIPLSDREIRNPLRGQYEWLGQKPQPAGWPLADSYDRFGWYELEPAEGQYDFSRVDRMLERASAMRPPGRHSIAVMSAMSCCDSGQLEWNGGVQVPDYVKERSNGLVADLDGPPSFWPDWNSEFYLSRWEALMQALGDRYRNDDRFGYMDIRGYGNYGEWHLEPGPSYPGPNGQADITTESSLRLVDAAVDAFSEGGVLRKHLVMLTPRDDALRHALARSPLVGVRGDCLGGHLGPTGGYISDESHPARSRWQTAPFVTEWCGEDGTEERFEQAVGDVAAYHVASLSSGNVNNVGDPPSESYLQALKASGYRFELNRLSLPAVIRRNTPFSVAATWSNVGVTPAYAELEVAFQLRHTRSGAVVHDSVSALDLRSLLPTGGSPATAVDMFAVPPSVKPGEYDVAVVVRDPSQYLAPLNLALEGRAKDGSYRLGTVRLR